MIKLSYTRCNINDCEKDIPVMREGEISTKALREHFSTFHAKSEIVNELIKIRIERHKKFLNIV